MEEKSFLALLLAAFKDRWLIWAFRLLGYGLLITFIWGWIDYRQDVNAGKHAIYLWYERNIPKGYPDTVWEPLIVYRDTSYRKSASKTFKDNSTNVESYNQKGGQTARDISNNK